MIGNAGKERINQSSGYNLRLGFYIIGLGNIWDECKDMNVVEFFSTHKGMEKGLKERRLDGGHWMSDVKGSGKCCGWNVEGM